MWLASEGLMDKVKPIQDCPPVRQYVQATVGKVSFPAIELEEGKVNAPARARNSSAYPL